jgi:LDH2 family malate/lactate/ureidoglycolate dehydrogenase
MKLYVVIQRGVYRHAIVGIWDSLEVAKQDAEKAIAMEPDAYHSMEIVETELNQIGAFDRVAGDYVVYPNDKPFYLLQRKMKDGIVISQEWVEIK